MQARAAIVCLTLTLFIPACAARHGSIHSSLSQAADHDDALVTADALEALIESGQASLADRQFAYTQIAEHPDDGSAGYSFARASVAGRVVQEKGLLAAPLLRDAETYAQRSRELDPDFRDSAATRMLGTLYVLVPAQLLQHGDSEVGLEMLEALTAKRPDVPENHLRLAEAYVSLHDPEPAQPHLCAAKSERSRLRKDDQALLDRLVKEVGKLDCP